MARQNDRGGWDFVKVGGEYQYKEDSFLAMIEILEDNSDDEAYKFKVKVKKSNYSDMMDREFTVSGSKTFKGVYSGMIQIYKEPVYYHPKLFGDSFQYFVLNKSSGKDI